jgi:hypothetical protein
MVMHTCDPNYMGGCGQNYGSMYKGGCGQDYGSMRLDLDKNATPYPKHN